MVEINQLKQVKVNVKTLNIHLKIRDQFNGSLSDQDGAVVHSFEDVYVPNFLPGDHYGDYLILDIDLDTGVITNWEKPTAKAIEEAMQSD
jgi:hypothetical protein